MLNTSNLIFSDEPTQQSTNNKDEESIERPRNIDGKRTSKNYFFNPNSPFAFFGSYPGEGSSNIQV